MRYVGTLSMCLTVDSYLILLGNKSFSAVEQLRSKSDLEIIMQKNIRWPQWILQFNSLGHCVHMGYILWYGPCWFLSLLWNRIFIYPAVLSFLIYRSFALDTKFIDFVIFCLLGPERYFHCFAGSYCF